MLIFLYILPFRAGAVTFLFATENSKPTLARFVATLGDKEKAEVGLCYLIVTDFTLLCLYPNPLSSSKLSFILHLHLLFLLLIFFLFSSSLLFSFLFVFLIFSLISSLFLHFSFSFFKYFRPLVLLHHRWRHCTFLKCSSLKSVKTVRFLSVPNSFCFHFGTY